MCCVLCVAWRFVCYVLCVGSNLIDGRCVAFVVCLMFVVRCVLFDACCVMFGVLVLGAWWLSCVVRVVVSCV